jgi:hypothetical protein
MISPTYGAVNLERIVEIIKDFVSKEKTAEYEITIGTDSQNFDKTKIVKVIAVHKIGGGGIFFYDVIYLPLIKELRRKLVTETQLSIDLANSFIDELEKEFDKSEWDYTEYHINFQLHCDIGYNGKTSELIPEITSWVRAAVPDEFEPIIKPDSFAASSIANKYSK